MIAFQKRLLLIWAAMLLMMLGGQYLHGALKEGVCSEAHGTEQGHHQHSSSEDCPVEHRCCVSHSPVPAPFDQVVWTPQPDFVSLRFWRQDEFPREGARVTIEYPPRLA